MWWSFVVLIVAIGKFGRVVVAFSFYLSRAECDDSVGYRRNSPEFETTRPYAYNAR